MCVFMPIHTLTYAHIRDITTLPHHPPSPHGWSCNPKIKENTSASKIGRVPAPPFFHAHLKKCCVISSDWNVAIMLPLWKGKTVKFDRSKCWGIFIDYVGVLLLYVASRPWVWSTSTLDRAIALRLLAERRHEHHQLMCAAYFVYTPKTCRYRQNLLLLHQQRGQSDWVILHLARYPSGFCSCSRFFNYRYWPTEQSQKNWVSMSTGPRSSFSPSAHVCPLNHPYSHGITSILFLDCPLQ